MRAPQSQRGQEEMRVAGGEELTEEDKKRADFLPDGSSQKGGNTQTKLKVFSGLEWMMRELLKEVAHTVIEMSSLTEGAEQWEEWSESSQSPTPQRREDPPQLQTRSRREERQLWAILNELEWLRNCTRKSRKNKEGSQEW